MFCFLIWKIQLEMITNNLIIDKSWLKDGRLNLKSAALMQKGASLMQKGASLMLLGASLMLLGANLNLLGAILCLSEVLRGISIKNRMLLPQQKQSAVG